MKIYRAAIVGCGRIGSEFDDDPKRRKISTHAGAYTSIENTELVAVCDVDETKLNKCLKRWQVPNGYRDYKDMFRKERIDLLSICTGSHAHFEIVKQAVKEGVRAIFCEKPIAESLAVAEKIVKLCREKRVILQINHQRRFDKLHREVKDYIQKGKLGKIQCSTFYYTAGIVNTGSHMFDLLRFLFGDARWVQGVFSQNHSSVFKDPNIDGIIKFKNGVFCSICACDVKEFLIFEMDVIGTKIRIKILKSGHDLEFYKIKQSDMFSGYKELLKIVSPISVPEEKFSAIVEGIKELIYCLEKKTESISSGEDGKKTLELICAMMKSAQSNGKRIYLPLNKGHNE